MQEVTDKTKLVGITVNCGRKHGHVQSMIYSTDEVGYRTMVNQSAIYNCRPGEGRWSVVDNYEIGMSRAVMRAGFDIAALFNTDGSNVKSVVRLNWDSAQTCRFGDPWFENKIERVYSPSTLNFFKVSRYLPEGMEAELNAMNNASWLRC